jgi:hypothetical protein
VSTHQTQQEHKSKKTAACILFYFNKPAHHPHHQQPPSKKIQEKTMLPGMLPFPITAYEKFPYYPFVIGQPHCNKKNGHLIAFCLPWVTKMRL